jgi:hypothetical protein
MVFWLEGRFSGRYHGQGGEGINNITTAQKIAKNRKQTAHKIAKNVKRMYRIGNPDQIQ